MLCAHFIITAEILFINMARTGPGEKFSMTYYNEALETTKECRKGMQAKVVYIGHKMQTVILYLLLKLISFLVMIIHNFPALNDVNVSPYGQKRHDPITKHTKRSVVNSVLRKTRKSF